MARVPAMGPQDRQGLDPNHVTLQEYEIHNRICFIDWDGHGIADCPERGDWFIDRRGNIVRSATTKGR